MRKPLVNYNGNKIIRGGGDYGVGKLLLKEGYDKLYFHKKYVDQTSGKIKGIYMQACSKMTKPFEYNCLMYDQKRSILRFDEAPDFDTAQEPTPGLTLSFNFKTEKFTKFKISDKFIWHHKWLWVGDDYKGFNVNESYKWSKFYISLIKETPAGTIDMWNKQLAKYVYDDEEDGKPIIDIGDDWF